MLELVIVLLVTIVTLSFFLAVTNQNSISHLSKDFFTVQKPIVKDNNIGLTVYGIPTGRFPYYIEQPRNWYSTQPFNPQILGTTMGA